MAENCRGFIPTCQCQEAPNVSFGDRPEMGKVCGLNSPFSVKLSSLFDYFINSWELELLSHLSDHRLSKDLWSMLLLYTVAAAAAKLLQSCPTLCDPIDGSPLGSSVPGILQARILEWVATSFSNAWKWKMKVMLLSCAQLLATPGTAACQSPPSMGFSSQEY